MTEADSPRADRSPSAPLYIAAGLAQIMGLLVIRFQIVDPTFAYIGIALTVLGLATAFRMRQKGVTGRIVPAGAVAAGLLFLSALSGTGLFGELLPREAVQGSELSVVVALALTAAVTNFLAVTDDAVVFTSVWVIAIIGLSGAIDVNRELVICFLIFMLCASFLLVHQNYLAQTRKAQATPAVTPALLKIQLLTAAAAWLAAVLCGGLLTIPLRSLSKGVSLKMVMEQLAVPPSALNARPRTSGRQRLVFDSGAEFQVGLGPVEDDQTELFTVRSPHPRYWRGRTQHIYDPANRAWRPREGTRLTLLEPTKTSADGETFTYDTRSPGTAPRRGTHRETHTFRALVPIIGSAFHAAEPVELVGPMTTLGLRTDGTLASRYEARTRYSVTSEVSDATPEALNQTPTDYPDSFRSDYLNVGPENAALRALAREAVGDARGPYQRAEAIRAFVAKRCLYTLSAREVPRGKDPALFFLNQSREGYCDLFATATTILCRYAGIPARIALGYNSGTPDPDDPNLFHLRSSNQHAWTEVYFAGYGWFPFDATVGTATVATAPVPTTPDKRRTLQERLLAFLPRFLLALGGLGVLYVVVTEVRRLPRLERAVGPPPAHPNARRIGRLYASALARLKKSGAPRMPFMTSQEHADSVRKRLGETLARRLDPLASLADRAAFAPDPPEESDVKEANRLLKELLTALQDTKGKTDASSP